MTYWENLFQRAAEDIEAASTDTPLNISMDNPVAYRDYLSAVHSYLASVMRYSTTQDGNMVDLEGETKDGHKFLIRIRLSYVPSHPV